jgi:hypothetical protein
LISQAGKRGPTVFVAGSSWTASQHATSVSQYHWMMLGEIVALRNSKTCCRTSDDGRTHASANRGAEVSEGGGVEQQRVRSVPPVAFDLPVHYTLHQGRSHAGSWSIFPCLQSEMPFSNTEQR